MGSVAPTPSATEAQAAPLGPAPSVLHEHLEELALELARTKVPADVWRIAPQLARALHGLMPMLERLGPGLLHIPTEQLRTLPGQLAAMPQTLADLERRIQVELRNKSPEELRRWLQDVANTADTWLFEYHLSIDPTTPTHATESRASAAEGAVPAEASTPEAPAPAAEESPADGSRPHDDPTPDAAPVN